MNNLEWRRTWGGVTRVGLATPTPSTPPVLPVSIASQGGAVYREPLPEFASSPRTDPPRIRLGATVLQSRAMIRDPLRGLAARNDIAQRLDHAMRKT